MTNFPAVRFNRFWYQGFVILWSLGFRHWSLAHRLSLIALQGQKASHERCTQSLYPRRHHSRRRRFVSHGASQIAVAVGRHYRHRTSGRAMARTGRRPNRRRLPSRRQSPGGGTGSFGLAAVGSHRKSTTRTRHVQLDPLRRKLDRLEAGDHRPGDCAR